MNKYDLMNIQDKDLENLYQEELKRVGATSLESIINEFNRRETKHLSNRMNILTVIILIFTVVSTITSTLSLLK